MQCDKLVNIVFMEANMVNITSLKKKVFLSYSYSEKMHIDLLCKKLMDEGFQVVTSRSELQVGKKISSLQESIETCDYFICILSSDINTYMKEEYSIALRYEKNILIFIKSSLYKDIQIKKMFAEKLVMTWEHETELFSKIMEEMRGFRYKYPQRGYRFEVLVEDILKGHGCNTRRAAYAKDAEYDVYAEKNGKKLYVEVKALRDKMIGHQTILSMIGRAKIMGLKDNEYFILVTANMVTKEAKELTKSIDNFLLIDIAELLYMVQDNEDLKYRLLSVVEFTTEDITLIEPTKFMRIIDVDAGDGIDSLVDNQDEIKRLLAEVKHWEQDKRTSVEYEKFCTKILSVLFSRDLTLWREQQHSNEDLYRFDLICKIKDDVTSAFWRFIEEYFRTKYIIFEFKNYKGVITQKEIYTTEKYLYAKALRSVAIIVSCNGSDDNAQKAIRGTLRENGKLILNLSNRDLENMLEYELNGNLPSEYLYNMLDEMLIELDK